MRSVLRKVPGTASSVAVLGVLGLVLGAGLLSVPCLFRFATGLDGPFCGGSRMIGAVLHGDLLSALDFNAFALLVFPPFVLAMLVSGARRELGVAARVWPSGFFGKLLGCGLAVVVLTWTVLRNLPFEPFTALRA
ncbi:hypothetical protein FHX42_002812 [Saccharopolyspora lacisalsi]|uniref:DUF2752 domain-containing protein n=1 Tax=Halosaccharopolyspora lacisalsi TaxID=1000566 RepID=A0A839E224_9PSEU|nr:DUF2752 domain-containing protein [Halosaccharopolyspora lacisalsi]MBA8825461.1 hypothetical protein [Halosaccharopolyspora lacisalsi]